jgi:hypothetical protein
VDLSENKAWSIAREVKPRKPIEGASEAPISESYGSSEQRGKTANWPAAKPKGFRRRYTSLRREFDNSENPVNSDPELTRKNLHWLDVKALARIEATSEDSRYPINLYLRKMVMVGAQPRSASRQSALSLISRGGSSGSGFAS